jgi:hypothetical protein
LPSVAKPPPLRSTLKIVTTAAAPTAGTSTALKTGGTTVHPKSTSGPLAVPGGAPTPGAPAAPPAPPTVASSVTVAGGAAMTTPSAAAVVAPGVPTTPAPTNTALGGPTLTTPVAGPKPTPSTKSVTPHRSAGVSANQAQTAVDPNLLATINGMVKGLESLHTLQELLVAGQQKLVEHLTQSMESTMPRVVSSGDVSSLAENLSSVLETVIRNSRGQISSDRQKRWYAVAAGRKAGISGSKLEALKSVLRFLHGCYKGFCSKRAAKEWLALCGSSTNKASMIPEDRSLKSSDSTQYESSARAGSLIPPRPINEILDVTKVEHNPSVGKAKELYGTSTEVELVLLKTPCPKGVTQTVREQMLEAAPDILHAPGKLPSGSSTTDTAALADSLANAVE